MTYCPLITKTFRILWIRYIRLSLRSKTKRAKLSASYLDLLWSIGSDGQLHTSLYDKRDDFNNHITNFPFLISKIPSLPAYPLAFSSHNLSDTQGFAPLYDIFILRGGGVRLSNKLLGQGYA